MSDKGGEESELCQIPRASRDRLPRHHHRLPPGGPPRHRTPRSRASSASASAAVSELAQNAESAEFSSYTAYNALTTTIAERGTHGSENDSNSKADQWIYRLSRKIAIARLDITIWSTIPKICYTRTGRGPMETAERTGIHRDTLSDREEVP